MFDLLPNHWRRAGSISANDSQRASAAGEDDLPQGAPSRRAEPVSANDSQRAPAAGEAGHVGVALRRVSETFRMQTFPLFFPCGGDAVARIDAVVDVVKLYSDWCWRRTKDARRREHREALAEDARDTGRMCWRAVRPPVNPMNSMLRASNGLWLTEWGDIDEESWFHWHPIHCRHNGEEDFSHAMGIIDSHCVTHGGLDMTMTARELRSACMKMSAHTSVSACGWRPRELAILPDAFLEALIALFGVFVERGQWPRLMACCCVSLIPKHESACDASGLRPIAVLSVVYRAWSSVMARKLLDWATGSFLPPGIKGGLEGHEPMDCYLDVAFACELAWLEGAAVAGATADVVKFVDRIPRKVLGHACIALGVPSNFVNAWLLHLDRTERHFRVGGGLGPPRRTTTGLPQGDALSVFGSIIITYLFHKVVSGLLVDGRRLDVDVLNWADNFQWHSRVASDVPATFACLESFCGHFDLDLKPSACWTWAAGPDPVRRKARALARYTARDGTEVQHRSHARELGAHVNYGRTRCAATVLERARSAREFLSRLSRAAILHAVKIMMIAPGALNAVVWGAETTPVPSKGVLHSVLSSVSMVLKPRRSKYDKRNPFLTCFLAGDLSASSVTVVFEALLRRRTQSVRTYLCRSGSRAQDTASRILRARSEGGGAFPDSLPIGLLVETWSAAGWTLSPDWHLVDPEGVRWSHVLRCSVQEISILIRWATADWISLKARAARAELAEVGRIDRETTLNFPRTLGSVARGRLMAVLTGLVYTQRDFAKMSAGETDSLCACGEEEETYEHRYRRCSLHAEDRAFVREIGSRESVPSPLATFGLAQVTDEERAFWRHLAGMQATPLPPLPGACVEGEDGYYDFYSDGSADPADQPRWRVAGSGIVWLERKEDGGVVWRKWSSPLPGLVQTITRAELLPLALLMEGVAADFRVYIDNDSVVSEARARIASAGRGLSKLYAVGPNGDLWTRFDDALRASPSRRVAVTKVRGHDGDAGNERADAAAKAGRRAHGPASQAARRAQERVSAQVRRVQEFQLAVQDRVLCACEAEEDAPGVCLRASAIPGAPLHGAGSISADDLRPGALLQRAESISADDLRPEPRPHRAESVSGAPVRGAESVSVGDLRPEAPPRGAGSVPGAPVRGAESILAEDLRPEARPRRAGSIPGAPVQGAEPISADDSQRAPAAGEDDLPPQHPATWGSRWSPGDGWRNSAASLPAGGRFAHGRPFIDRFLKWWRALEWPARCDQPVEDRFGQISFVELAVLFEIHTQTRFSVTPDAGRSWLLPDVDPTASVLTQTLKQKGMLINAVTRVLQRHCDNFVMPPRCSTRVWTMYGCQQRSASLAVAMRPRGPRALATQLETFFNLRPVRRSTVAMDHVFGTSLGGPPQVDVHDHVAACASVRAILEIGVHPPQGVERKLLHIESVREGSQQHAVANRARGRHDDRGVVLTEGRVVYVNPSCMTGEPPPRDRGTRTPLTEDEREIA